MASKYAALDAKVRRLKQQMGRSVVPSKAQVKRSGKGAFVRKDKELLARLPGGGIVGMIAAQRTGCRIASRDEEARLRNSARNADTTTFRSGR